jgi:flagellar export protein FliJ
MKEKQALMEVAKVQSKINTFLTSIDKLHKEFDLSQRVYYRESQKEFWVDGAKMFNRYIERLNDDEDFFRGKIKELQPLLKDAQKKFLKANAEKKVVERLKEKRWEEYQYKLKREMQAESNETNLNLYASLEKKKVVREKEEGTALQKELQEQDKIDQLLNQYEDYQKQMDKDAFMGYRGRGRK